MGSYSRTDLTLGVYQGRIDECVMQPLQRQWLEAIAAHVHAGDARVLTAGRNQNVCLEMPSADGPLAVVVKVFGLPGRYQSWRSRRMGSKARRTWEAAVHLAEAGVGTPSPLAFLERWSAGRPVESYMVTVFQAGLSSFASELNRIFREDPASETLMALLETVAAAVRALHAAGFVHYDLGNQNILLRRTGAAAWGDVQFLDLNRGRIRPTLSGRERARDLSRITLPSDFLRVFREMYYGGQTVPPEAFLRWEACYRQCFAWHSRTRRWRHPFREARRKSAPGAPPSYPEPKDIWIWDERSGQPLVTMVPRDRAKHYPLSRTVQTVSSALRALPSVLPAYHRRLAAAYGDRVDMRGRIGVAVEVQSGTLDRKLALLAALGPLPVLVRFYHHRGLAGLTAGVAFVETLAAHGYPVSIALVQDRQAVLEPARWCEFTNAVLARVGGRVEMVEAGHAVNRVKWGVWDYGEYRRLMAPLAAWKQKHAGLMIGGPAMIDFEYAYIPAALDHLPPGFGLDLLTHHLYVDRRGMPETPQGRFATLEKLALARAVAGAHPRCADRLVITEFNWPLEGTGVYSPVGAPYVSPGARGNDPSVSETDAAAYLLRYVLVAICSGLAERVFWWRLVAHGYGLVDDVDPAAWRERPAFRVLTVLLRRLHDSVFSERGALPGQMPGTEGVVYGFETTAGGRWWLAYTTTGSCRVRFPHPRVRVTDAFGICVAATADGGSLALGGMPIYVEAAGEAAYSGER